MSLEGKRRTGHGPPGGTQERCALCGNVVSIAWAMSSIEQQHSFPERPAFPALANDLDFPAAIFGASLIGLSVSLVTQTSITDIEVSYQRKH